MQTIAESHIENSPSQEEFFLILGMLPTPISWATLRDRRIRFYNKAFAQRFGYTAEHVITFDDFIASHVAKEKQGAVRKLWSSLWEKNKSYRSAPEMIPGIEIDIQAVDGTVATVMLSGLVFHAKGVFIAFFDDAKERDQAQKSALRHAYEDYLTGLANRRKLMMRWNQMAVLGQTSQVAFLMLDLDHFKQVNDQLGHDAGDNVLRIVAKRLLSCVRGGDLVCRFGGDEFGILLCESTDQESIEQICQRVLETVKTPMYVSGHEVCIGTSVGVSRVPDHGTTFDEIFKAADEALYQCKISGRGCWRWANNLNENKNQAKA